MEDSLRATLTTLEWDTARTFTPAITTLAEAAKENAKAITDLRTLTLPAMTAAATENAKAIMDLTAAMTANASALAELRQGLTACAAVKPIVDDIRYSQLPKIWDSIKKVEAECAKDVATVTAGVHALDTKFMDGLDMVNIRVDEMLRSHTPPNEMPPPNAMPIRASTEVHPPRSMELHPPRTDAAAIPHVTDTSTVAVTSPPQCDDQPHTEEILDDTRLPTRRPAPMATSAWSSFTFRQSESHQSIPGYTQHSSPVGGMAWGSGEDVRMQEQYAPLREQYAPRFSTSNRYAGERDSQNEAAKSDPRRFSMSPPQYHLHPSHMVADYGSDDEDNYPQGGQIISPRHWDRCQLAQSAGLSHLDAEFVLS